MKLDFDTLKRPEHSSIYRATGYFDYIFKGSLDDLDVWIAGGCFRAYFQPSEKIEDIDMFTINRKEAFKLVKVLRNEFNFKPYFVNNNAIKGVIDVGNRKYKVDVVKRFYQDADLCIKDFDFSVSKFAYHLKNKYVCYSDNYFADLVTKRLVIPDTEYGNPIGGLKRLQKYINKGYSACNGTLLTIAQRINTTDLSDPKMNEIEYYPDGRGRILLYD